MDVREYLHIDRDAVVALWQACGLTRPWNDPDQDIKRCLEGETSNILVGLDEGRVVASAMAGHDGHRAWVYYVAVDPCLQGSGAGREVMAAAERWLEKQGAIKVMLMIREDNEAVRGFYEHLGYEVEPRVTMSRWLNRD